MKKKQLDNILLFQFNNFSNHDDIIHFVSARNRGVSNAPYDSLNLSFNVGDDFQDVLKNREKLASVLGVSLGNFTIGNQVHGDNIFIVTASDKGRGAYEHNNAVPFTDAIATSVPGVCLMVLTADCASVLFYDPVKKVIAAVHAGWRGTVKKITQKTVAFLRDEFGCEPSDIIAGIGPSIGPDANEVQNDVIIEVEKVFGASYKYIIEKERKAFFDLWHANKAQAVAEGIPAENIEIANLCTVENNDLFYSVRCSEKTGRFGTGIMLKPIWQ